MKIQDIEPGKYEGYLWYSNENRPRVFLGDQNVSFETSEDAFIVEGLLWQKATLTSIRISFHDGESKVYKTNVKSDELEGCGNVTCLDYLAHRMPGIKYLSFIRRWNAETDSLCENFEVLTPGSLVFVGFNNIKL